MENPKEWYDEQVGNDMPWEYDENVKGYHAGDIYVFERKRGVSFEDTSETAFFGWSTEDWINLAQENELLYGYYNEDDLEAEFVHIKNGKCVRDYREYDGEVETDEGHTPPFEDWADVSMFVDEKML